MARESKLTLIESSPAPLRPESALSDQRDRVLDALGLEICNSRIAAGSTFSTESVEQRFQVSRPVVREALRALEALGMILPRRRVGMTVMPMSFWNVQDIQVIRWRLAGAGRVAQLRSLTELRTALEPAAARMAAVRASVSQASELTELAGELFYAGKAGKVDEFLQLDIRFHSMVLELTGNEMFAKYHHLIAEVLLGRTQYNLMPQFPSIEALQFHLDIALAIQAGKPDMAAAAMLAIMDRAIDEMGSIWNKYPPQTKSAKGPKSRNKSNLGFS
jgi:DNA-binding FadR family transcriptional regulator